MTWKVLPGVPRMSRLNGAICSVEGCGRKVLARMFCDTHYDRASCKSMCKLHYNRSIKGQKLDAAISLRGKYGTHRGTYRGYVTIYVPPGTPGRSKGKILEHRHVMQQMLGRPLLKYESAHHKNGDRSDNRPDNLELWSSNQPSGQRVADKVLFAIEILTLYPSFTDIDLVDLMSLQAILAKAKKKRTK